MASTEELEAQILAEMESNPEAYADTGIKYCTVDDDTRLVTIPDKYKKLGVESDEKAKRIWFRFPKLVGNNGVDLSAIGVRVNFRNANGDGDIYIVEDLTTDGDYVIFSWELTRKVTAYKGHVSFVVCAVKSANGTTKNEWNTTLNKECEVFEGLEVTEQIAQENPDIIEYILANLGGSVSAEEIATAVEEYMIAHPPSGMTAEEKAQLQKNTEDISSLSEEIADLGDSGTGLTTSVINALLNAFAHVAWTDENGQSYYDELATALNSSGSDSEEGGDEGSGDDEGGTIVVTLTSISATYSGGEVASGTALSDLTGIVVTGNYSDGTTKTITNYELSGEIASGTNTITVSYGGLTTTFEVVGTASTRTYLEIDAYMQQNTYKGVVYSDDGETTTTISTPTGYVINQTFEEDVDIHFKLTWGATTIWRNLYLASAVPGTLSATNTYRDISTMYRVKSLVEYYVEGDGTSYCYAGNVYEGVYTLKAGCVLAIGNMNSATAGQHDAENTYFYVEG